MKFISIPEPIQITSAETFSDAFSYSMRDCVTFIVDSSELFAHPASRIRVAMRVLAAFDNDPNTAALEDGDWQLLNAAFEAAPAFANFAITRRDGETVVSQEPFKIAPRRFLPFIEAIANASSVEA